MRARFDFRFTMDTQRLFIANLAKGKLGHDKANLLAYVPRQCVDLSRFEVLVKLLTDGQSQEPFLGTTLMPLEKRVGRASKHVARTRERFASPRATCEARLNRWMADSRVARKSWPQTHS